MRWVNDAVIGKSRFTFTLNHPKNFDEFAKAHLVVIWFILVKHSVNILTAKITVYLGHILNIDIPFSMFVKHFEHNLVYFQVCFILLPPLLLIIRVFTLKLPTSLGQLRIFALVWIKKWVFFFILHFFLDSFSQFVNRLLLRNRRHLKLLLI